MRQLHIAARISKVEQPTPCYIIMNDDVISTTIKLSIRIHSAISSCPLPQKTISHPVLLQRSLNRPKSTPHHNKVLISFDQPRLNLLIHLASTSPGDGAHIPADQIRDPSEVDRNDPNINVVEIPAEKKPPPSFKQQVFGECLSYNSDIRTHTPVGYAKV
jgi:hypothetical protein